MAVRLSALRAGRPLTPGRFLALISARGWVDPMAIMRLEELDQLKNRITSSEIEPATFRLVALCLNQLRYRVPRTFYVRIKIIRHPSQNFVFIQIVRQCGYHGIPSVTKLHNTTEWSSGNFRTMAKISYSICATHLTQEIDNKYVLH
jgi:hypothetical protein